MNVSRYTVICIYSRLASISQRRFLNVWMSFDPIFKLTTWGKRHNRALRVTHGFVNKVNIIFSMHRLNIQITRWHLNLIYIA